MPPAPALPGDEPMARASNILHSASCLPANNPISKANVSCTRPHTDLILYTPSCLSVKQESRAWDKNRTPFPAPKSRSSEVGRVLMRRGHLEHPSVTWQGVSGNHTATYKSCLEFFPLVGLEVGIRDTVDKVLVHKVPKAASGQRDDPTSLGYGTADLLYCQLPGTRSCQIVCGQQVLLDIILLKKKKKNKSFKGIPWMKWTS